MDTKKYPMRIIEASSDFTYIKHNGEGITCRFDEWHDFSDGLALVKTGGKYGFIDTNGQIAVKPEFQLAMGFMNGLAPVVRKGKWVYINTNGDVILKNVPGVKTLWHFSDELALAKSGKLYGYINTSGDWAIKPCFDYGGYFSDGCAVACLDDKWGHINRSGEWIYEPSWERTYDFREGLAMILDESERLGFIDKTGKVVIKPKWHEGHGFSDGLAAVCNNNKKWGFINKKGKYEIKAKFSDASSFSNGLAAVQKGDYYGYIDRTGEMEIKNCFHYAGSFKDGLVEVQASNGWLVINSEGTVILDTQGTVPKTRQSFSLVEDRRAAENSGLSINEYTAIRKDLKNAEFHINSSNPQELHYFYQKRGITKYLLERDKDLFFSDMSRSALVFADRLENIKTDKNFNKRELNSAFEYFLNAITCGDFNCAVRIDNSLTEILHEDKETKLKSVDLFTLTLRNMFNKNDDAAKESLLKFTASGEEGSTYLIEILYSMHEKKSNEFSSAVLSYLDNAFGPDEKSDIETIGSTDYIEILAGEYGMSVEQLVKHIKHILESREGDVSGIDEMTESELVDFIEENNLFCNKILNPWFIEFDIMYNFFMSPLCLGLIALARYRGMKPEVIHRSVPAELQERYNCI